MSSDPKTRVETAVPAPDEAKHLNEDEKRALELSGEIEHAHGVNREQMAEKADAAAGGEQRSDGK